MKRRDLLKAGAAATGLSGLTAGCTSSSSEGRNFVPVTSGLQNLSLVATSPGDEYFAQTGGGPDNQNYVESDLSPIGIESHENVSSRPVNKQPVLSGDGEVTVTGEEVAVLIDQNGNVTEIDTVEETSTPIIVNGSAILGDATANMKYDLETGEKTGEIETDSRAFNAMGAGNYFQTLGGGFASFDPEEMTIEEEYQEDMTVNPFPEGIIPVDETTVYMVNGDIVKRYILGEGTEADTGQETFFTEGISRAGDNIVATSRIDDFVAVLDGESESMEIKDMLEGYGGFRNGGTYGRASSVIPGEDELKIFNVNDDGLAFGLNYDLEDESLSETWSRQLEGEGLGAVTAGDVTVMGTDAGIYGLDIFDGEEVFSSTDVSGRPSNLVNDTIYIASEDEGLYRLDMEMGAPENDSPELGFDFRDETVPDTMTVNEDAELALYFENTGEGSFDGSLLWMFESDYDPEEYSAEMPVVIDSNSNGHFGLVYDPVNGDANFQYESLEPEDFSSGFADEYSPQEGIGVQQPIPFPEDENESTASIQVGPLEGEVEGSRH